MGLSTVHGIVNQSGGHIRVYNELGLRTTFKIYLPCTEATEDAGIHVETLKNPACGSETILVVEDEQIVRDIIRATLTDSGYSLLLADCGETAQHICATHEGPIHLLLTDGVMPGDHNDPQVAKALAPKYPQIKVLYMSGYNAHSIGRHGVLGTDIAFIQKPFKPIYLKAKVRGVLDDPGPAST